MMTMPIKALMIVSDHMEDVEALATRALLMRAGISVTTVTVLKSQKITTAFGLTFQPDACLDQVTTADFDVLIVPGGKYVQMIIEDDVRIQETVRAFDREHKLIASICAGPRFLGRAGVLDGKRFTAFPGSEKDIPAGTYLPMVKAITDGNTITARGAGAVYEFAHQIVTYLLGEQVADRLMESIRY